ncbi:hypothetical protein [Aeromicrobium sp. 9AM]|uniref:hypothetical protein n=1 Tax=Aeromicrobium sp. 9AM TaxID=2653126 RepID=UPI0012F04A99|nr:hypothetical protein [Aeromicrobium sp. 9AM]VXC27851.1 membrane hypothetical protein [Aeromicrobium sp. 9AM]
MTAQAWVLGIVLGLIWVVGAWILVTHLRRGEKPEPVTPFARIYPAAYLAVMAVLWLTAFPAFLDAKDGLTSDGTPIGSGLYTIACAIAASAVLHAGRAKAHVDWRGFGLKMSPCPGNHSRNRPDRKV